LHIALWVLQVLIGLSFMAAGGMKAFTPAADLMKAMPWVENVGIALPRFIGISELAGGLGLILPAATRIKPGLTPLAAAGLTVVMVLAVFFHISRGEYPMLGAPVVLGGLCAFIAWGRSRKAPIPPR